MADNSKYAQLQAFSLAGSGASVTNESIILTSFKSIDGVNLTMTDFGTKGFGTIEPNNSVREEQISFSGITQNSNGTATLTGVKSVLFLAPYTESTGLSKSHAGGVKFIITNTSGFYNRVATKDNDETITGLWDFSTSIPTLPDANPTTDNQAVRKKYVDDNFVTIATNQTITGVKTFAQATAVPRLDAPHTYIGGENEYLATKQYVDDTASFGAPLADTTTAGIVQEATPTEIQAGTGTGTTGARLYINPEQFALSGALTTPTVQVFTISGTWSKPANLKYAVVETVGGGGAGAGLGGVTGHRAGGGGGGYSRKTIAAGTLGATETVTIGAGGVGGTSNVGPNGGTTSFGAHCQATGGVGGSTATGGDGGVGSGGDANSEGSGGGSSNSNSPSGSGGNSVLGGGAASITNGPSAGNTGGVYGGGGSGAIDGGSSTTRNGGSGATGAVIVTHYF